MEPQTPPEVVSHYDDFDESARLSASGDGRLELIRTRELLLRHLPAPPADLADVGGGPGVHASWLTRLGYRVRLLDPSPKHVRQAAALATPPLSVERGDARSLPWDSHSFDAALLLGPLYHLIERDDRLAALAEATRIVRPGGLVAVAAISRFASAIQGLWLGFIDDPTPAGMVQNDLSTGVHRADDADGEYFTTAYYHLPDDLRGELSEAGLSVEHIYAVEGIGWAASDLDARTLDAHRIEPVLRVIRATEEEPALIGASPHLLAIGRRS
ncbi:MAG: methyltransferase domain-containing protein [Acidimicrobiia bacterium]|nr:methyltransferase domain-containing protein [Acidimicrobiia bacterium]